MSGARAPDHPSEKIGGPLENVARTQIRRDPWPEFERFDPSRYELALRRRTARQWWRRAREEYGSIHEFTALAHALCEARAPIDLLSALSRLITDEARHAELCAAMARALVPDEDPSAIFEWSPPAAPWPNAPAANGGDVEPLLAWAADVVLCACCIGETISRPLFDALATSITDPVPASVVRQILRDEHLHAAFGWETLAWLRARLGERSRAGLETRLARRLAGFEKSCVVDGVKLEDLVGRELVVASPGPGAPPNLGLLDPHDYAMIFYATIESEILPRFEALGFDAARAWRER
jgi:hypothetical protein